ncbi:MAG: hypothetical protein LBP62_01650 [Clostridiales bacterium]|nr:hypothetical protein [Clostridiales bacterium]
MKCGKIGFKREIYWGNFKSGRPTPCRRGELRKIIMSPHPYTPPTEGNSGK